VKIQYRLSNYNVITSSDKTSIILCLQRDSARVESLLLGEKVSFRQIFLDLTNSSYTKIGLVEILENDFVKVSTSFTGPSLFVSKLNDELYIYDSEARAYEKCAKSGYEIEEQVFIRMLFSDNLCARPAHMSIFKGLYRCPPGATIRVQGNNITCSPRFDELLDKKQGVLSDILIDMMDETYSLAASCNKKPRLLFSGGMDSLLIGSIMKLRGELNIKGFHFLYHNLVSRTTAIAIKLSNQLKINISLIGANAFSLEDSSVEGFKRLFSSGTGVLASVKNYFYYENLSNQASDENILLITGQNADTLLTLDHKFPSTQLLLWERLLPTFKTVPHRYDLYLRSRQMTKNEDEVITCLNSLRAKGSSTSISEHGDTSDEFRSYIESFLATHFNDDYLKLLVDNPSQFVGYSELAIEKVIRWYRTCGNVELNYDALERGLGLERHIFFNHPKFIVYGLNNQFSWKDIFFVKPRFARLVKKFTRIRHRRTVVIAVLSFLPFLLKRKFNNLSDQHNEVSEGDWLTDFIMARGILIDLYQLIECVNDDRIKHRLNEILKKIEEKTLSSSADTKVALRLVNLYFSIGCKKQ